MSTDVDGTDKAGRRTAIVAGVLFLVTEVAAIAGAVLYRPLLGGGGAAADAGGRAVLGALCELVLVAAVAGTGVTLFPVVKRWGEALALGYVCARLLEAALILLGIVAVLALTTLRQEAPEPGAAAVDAALVAVHDWTFLLGPNIALGVNTALLALLMYRSRLVPRPIAVLGLIGGPLICTSAVAVMSGLYAQLSVPGSLAALPVFAWELSLAVWLVVKGFRRTRGSD
ncbi:DUF4386 domain-containing protein [Streptomyces sp. NBC_00091]|uniref:DUF4386 domain-containing protein n=1 Tax=Streptomyces sp. NBC_00091 TaxID=2975648 RepID=UPI00224FE686|nr:DUF4386 domain-containing protein [Streptomyces sp. NBC_00091]MCX5376256.1 DUF4386 domain-containing protein [Streptomyces sp. NBC_00091]